MVRKLIVGRNNGYYIRKRGGQVFSPNDLSDLLQFVNSLSYSTSTFAFYPYLVSSKTGESVAQPRAGRAYLFDGVDDRATAATPILTGTGDFTVCGWIKFTSGAHIAGNLTGANLGGIQIYMSSSKITMWIGAAVQGTTILSTGVWYHYAIVRSSGNITFYLNGAADGTATAAGNITGNSNWSIGGRTDNLGWFSGSMYDHRVYNVAKNASEVAAIYNEYLTPNTVDTTGALGIWPCQEEAGTTSYDVGSASPKNMTITNATVPTPFHTTDTGVKWSFPNQKGYTLSGSTIIPASLINANQDAAGGALQNVGPILLPTTTEVPCMTGDGTVYADFGGAFVPKSGDFELSLWAYVPSTATIAYTVILGQVDGGPWAQGFAIFYETGVWKVFYGIYTVHVTTITGLTLDAWNYIKIRKVGTTLFASSNNGTESSVACAASINSLDNTKLGYSNGGQWFPGRTCDLQILQSGATTYFPVQDGPGAGNTNRNIAWVKSDGTGAVITNAIIGGTVATLWANRCPYAKDWSVQYGGGIASGAFVAGRIGAGTDAAGNAKTLVAGKIGNPYSRINFNVFGAPSLNNINAETAYAITTARQSVAPNDTKFRRTKTDGDDRFFSTISSLTGSNLTNANAYVA